MDLAASQKRICYAKEGVAEWPSIELLACRNASLWNAITTPVPTNII